MPKLHFSGDKILGKYTEDWVPRKWQISGIRYIYPVKMPSDSDIIDRSWLSFCQKDKKSRQGTTLGTSFLHYSSHQILSKSTKDSVP
jgi:hypothetical protein